MTTLYLEFFSKPDGKDNTVLVPVETAVALFSYKLSLPKNITLVGIVTKGTDPCIRICMGEFSVNFHVDVTSPANLCKLPTIVTNNGTTCVAGLCAVVRQIFKSADDKHPLLGFKQSCLYACAEVSVWTKFCEVDMVECVKRGIIKKSTENGSEVLENIPVEFARFEKHLSQPVRAHNIQKVKQDAVKALGGNKCSIPDSRLQITAELSHEYAEGACMSIADVILLVCFHIIAKKYQKALDKLPLTLAWYRKMVENLGKSLQFIFEVPGEVLCFDMPCVKDESLYKSDPRRYKPRNRIFTRQEEVDESLDALKDICWDMIEEKAFGSDLSFDWAAVPWDAQPAGGDLPVKRAARKAHQLEGMARAILSVARHGDVLVDFCAGSGHLGLILAHSLPRCTILLLENKEESLSRARERAQKLKLTNIFFCQSNVDYFCGSFTIGVSLHACGVATDLVLESCLKQNAAFVCCPCCYGSVQANHIVTYPRSSTLRKLLTERQYLVLGHAADQTHENNPKNEQGLRCMDIIDGDRCLRAREFGYRVKLGKLFPITCTPKNNLLMGIPRERGLF